MQGDFSSGCEVLAEYLRIKKKLEKLSDNMIHPSIVTAIDDMLMWLKKYQDESMDTEIIVIATILNPRRRLKFFQDFYPDDYCSAQDSIKEVFEDRLAKWTPTESPPQTQNQKQTTPNVADEFDMFAAGSDHMPTSSEHEQELPDYLSGKFGILPDEKPLDWWRVSSIYHSIYTFFVCTKLDCTNLKLQHRNT